MIVVVTTPQGRHTIDSYLALGGASVRDVLTVWTYPELAARRARGPLPAGTYVFADVERTTARTRAEAADIWQELQADAARWRTLGHPERTPRRLALLERLHAQGVNDFRAWRADLPAPGDARFPVFVRVADDHDGPRGDLLDDRAALVKELSRIAGGGDDLARWIVTEYAGAPRPDGTFVKHGAFVVDGAILPRHIFLARRWIVKYGEVSSADVMHGEWCLLATGSPHAALLAEVCREAHIGWGRIDYDVDPTGRVRIWEINTNPQIVPVHIARTPLRRSYTLAWQRRFEALVRALDARVPSPPARVGWLERARWRALVADDEVIGLPLERRLWGWARAAWTHLRR
ncbi:MAG: hypothetical protein IT385_25760 [Deltaproteobacteria bacterium]|nr:hypothetical protein [Deltaproteobacteria bacterium]